MEAFEILAEQYRPMLLVYLKTLLRDEHLAEDLTQESLITAQRSLATFKKGANFGAWLRGIARMKTMENRRASTRRHIVADSRIIEGMEQVYSVLDNPDPRQDFWSDRAGFLRDCVGRLSERLRGAIIQVYQEGKDLVQAAAALKMSSAALAQRLHRARELLHQCVSLRLKGDSSS